MFTSADTQRASHRNDQIGWFTGQEKGWTVLPAYMELIDHLVALLRPKSDGVAGCLQRAKAMVSCYKGSGTHYTKHCDNMCNEGGGSGCNGRRLTCILYLNHEWRPCDGGELLLYPRLVPSGQATQSDPSVLDAHAIGTVAPLANRLLIFYADVRCPHEVLPSFADRFAITAWYYDQQELGRMEQQRRGGGR